MVYEEASTGMEASPHAKISEISIAIVDNGFVVRVHGPGIQKNYVVQAGSSDPDEIDLALDVVRRVYLKVRGI